MGQHPGISVVIPAHNESTVIERCLRALSAGAEDDELEVVVVCNGCTDDTAERARSAWPAAKVVVVDKAGKANALSVGDQHASRFPRFYVDADVEMTVESLRRVASHLEDANPSDSSAVLCATPRPQFVLEGRPWTVRSFHRIWQQLRRLDDEMVGCGVYGLSRIGRSRFGDFPAIVADDQYILQLFDSSERTSVGDASVTIYAPRKLVGLWQMRRRVYRGNRELAASGLTAHTPTGPRGGGIFELARHPGRWADLAVYVAINLAADLASRRGSAAWERDESSRVMPAAASSPVVGYLTSGYPMISHTFIQREVAAVRKSGVRVDTMTVQRTPPSGLLSEEDRVEDASTWALRPISLLRVATIHLRALLRHPKSWAETLSFAVRQSPPGVKAHIWQVLYFAQAIIVWDECKRRGLHHLHVHLTNVAADLAWLATTFGSLAEPAETWQWSVTVHGPTELFDVKGANLAKKVEGAALVICISDFTRSQVMSLVPEQTWSKLHVVHMGVDLDRYQFRRSASGPPEGTAANTLHILAVGRLTTVKGQAVLIDAVASLKSRGVPVELTLVGGGPLADELAHQADRLKVTELVTLCGPLGQDDLPECYRTADVFCLPSFAEGLPVVLMEAMATGVPVVATAVNGIPELVENEVTGLLVPPARPDALADALERLAGDADLRGRLSAAGRARIEAEFDSYSCGVEVAGLLHSLHES